MTRQEALEQFTDEALPILEQGEAAFSKALESQAERLAETLKNIFFSLRHEAAGLEKEKLMFFHISILRTGILRRTWQFTAQAMDARWYLDTEPAQIYFSLDFLFSAYDTVHEKLISDIRKYMGKVNSYDVEHLIEESVMKCNSILAQQTRYMLRDIEENEDFAAMEKTEVWSVYWGEYRDACELVAYVNREPKSQVEFERMLRQTKNKETSMIFSYWYNANLKKINCEKKLLYFIQFENCDLKDIIFDSAVLTGARFKNCHIQNCSFKEAELRQADFPDCVLEGNDFSGADLENAVFAEQKLPFLHLDAEQLQVILVDRGRS